jgi:molecular chaperone DnaK (HSP70)
VIDKWTLNLSLIEFEHLITPMIERTITCCKQALLDAGLKKSGINNVVMVGGSTRVPLVKKMVGDFFGKSVNDSGSKLIIFLLSNNSTYINGQSINIDGGWTAS